MNDKREIPGRIKPLPALIASLAFVSTAAVAQATDAAPSADAVQDSALPTVTVKGANRVNANDVLPKRPQGAIYGTETSVVDTPRSVNLINAEQIASDPIRTADDLVKYAPGVTRGGGQNVSIAPQIRGQNTEVFQDGQRAYNVRHPTNFNAYEGADIVAGPSSVVFGPSSSSGGYINYLSKLPNFDKPVTTVSGLLGTWAPRGESWKQTRLTFDTTAPINDRAAYRVSITGQRADDYFDNVKNNFNAFYGALAFKPRNDLRIDWNASYDDYYDFNVTHGWNRVTQQLVDSEGKQYAAGRATPLVRIGNTIYSPVYNTGGVAGWQTRTRNAQGQYVANPGLVARPGGAGSVVGWVYDPNSPGNGLASISPATSGRAEDRNTATRLTSQLRVAWDLSPKWTLRNSSFYERSADTGDSVGSFLSQFDDKIFENRVELRGRHAFDLGGVKATNDSNTGFTYRRESYSTKAANNSFNINPYDLTLDPSLKTPAGLYGLPLQTGASGSWIGSTQAQSGANPANIVVNSPYFGLLNIPAMFPAGNGLYAEIGGTPGATYTSEGRWTTVSFFTQHNLLFNERFGLNIGGNASFIDARIRNPLGPERKDSNGFYLPSYQASAYYKPTPDSSIYFTIDRSTALNTGGFANVLTWGGLSAAGDYRNQLNPLAFDSKSELKELGVKADLIPNKLYASLATFYQTRDTAPDTNGNMHQLKVRGVESAIRFQPERNISSGVNLTWLDAWFTSIVPAGFSPFGFYADNATVWGDSNRLNGRTAGRYDAAGIPAYSITGFFDYRFDNGFGIEVTAWWTSKWYTNLSKTVTVPDQYNVDVALHYRAPKWNAALRFLNVTDQVNFSNGLAGSTSEFLQPTRPFSVLATFAYSL
jgi:hypothetical protein